MFVNSCLIKVCFCMNETCIFVSVCSLYCFFSLLGFIWKLQQTFFAASSIVSVCWCVERKKGVQSSYIIEQDCSFWGTVWLWKRLGHWNYRRPLTSWRQHLSLHVKPVLFHCLWVTYTFHFIIRCNKNILFQGHFFLSFNKPVPDRQT